MDFDERNQTVKQYKLHSRISSCHTKLVIKLSSLDDVTEEEQEKKKENINNPKSVHSINQYEFSMKRGITRDP